MRNGRQQSLTCWLGFPDFGFLSSFVYHLVPGIITALFSTTLFLSASLLFWVQPMIAKMLLPLLGGVPAVWNTCLVFFQTMLLGGYAYAHFVSTRLSMPKQMTVHFSLLAVS